jgi:hypothetical protein
MTHSKTYEEHIQHLEVLLSLLRQHKLMVKLSKCRFAQKEVKFLGHLISHQSIKTNPQAVEAIQKWTRPDGDGKKAVTAIRGFLGMTGWFRKFIPRYAHIAKPLNNLTRKDIKFVWTDECQDAFNKLRNALVSAPVLATADPNKKYILHTDASDRAMGAILMQEDSGGDVHVIAYASKTFSPAEVNYDTTEREALAIVWALEHFNTYCEGHDYVIITDHQALSFIKTTKTSKRVHRWNLRLASYKLDIMYKKGSDNYAADLLSRKLMKFIKADEQQQPTNENEAPTTNKEEKLSSPVAHISTEKHSVNVLHIKKKIVKPRTRKAYEIDRVIDK